MNYLSVENISKAYGDKNLFQNISFGINKGEKIALVAKNGSGKSSLLKILLGKESADSGNYTFRKDISISVVEQNEDFDLNKTALENVLSSDPEISKIILNYEKALQNPDDTDAYQKAFEEMEKNQLWDYESQIQQILGKLGIQNFQQKASELSGGQKKRLSLAKGLAKQADFYILDEPTNHLDLQMIEWLENYLTKSNATLFLITHDRYFLDRVCTSIYELSDHKMYKYKGNFSYYIEKKSERETNEDTVVNKAKNLMKTELEWVRRMPKARGTKSKSRLEAFDELKKTASKRRDDNQMEFVINPERIGSKILEIHKVSKQFKAKKIVEKFDYIFKKGDRIGIVGNNGTGKSTFLNLITNNLQPDTGKIVVGETIKFGYYHQDGLKLKEDKRVIEVIKDIAEFVPLKSGKKLSASQLLEKFLFDSKAQYRYVSTLSGGEKRKLYLLTVLIENPNFLILDEPTNDLDINTLTALEDYLIHYPGILLVVSHDRYFMDKMVDHLFVLNGGGGVKDYPGNYSQYRIWVDENKNSSKSKQTEEVIEKKVEKPKVEKKKNKLSYKEKIEFEQLEKDIETLENKRAEMNEKVSNNDLPNDSESFFIELANLSKDIDEKTERWLELSEYI